MRYCLVCITTKDEDEARKIGRVLVAEKLAAGINIHPIESIYWWQEEVREENEVAMLVKTKAKLVNEVITRIKALHSYRVPCIISLPIEEGYPDFLAWINQSTK